MKRLLGYLKNYRFRALLAPLFKMLEASFELMVPLVMIKLIDIGITNKDKDFIISCGIVLVALTVVINTTANNTKAIVPIFINNFLFIKFHPFNEKIHLTIENIIKWIFIDIFIT